VRSRLRQKNIRLLSTLQLAVFIFLWEWWYELCARINQSNFTCKKVQFNCIFHFHPAFNKALKSSLTVKKICTSAITVNLKLYIFQAKRILSKKIDKRNNFICECRTTYVYFRQNRIALIGYSLGHLPASTLHFHLTTLVTNNNLT